jgi:hypothetical protein
MNDKIRIGLAGVLFLLFAAACGPSGDGGVGPDATADALSAGCGKLPITAVVASTVESPNVAANAIDSSLSTRWSGYGVGAYITADLGATASLCAVDIAWYRGNARKSSFTISVSTDGAGYATVYSGKSSGTTTSDETYTFSAVSARYVRVTVNGNTENDWASITDLRVGGASSGSPPPPPPPPPSGVLFSDSFNYPDGLVTNEYAYWTPNGSGAVHSPLWEMDSGSLFAKGGRGWSGVPDGTSPDADSMPYNDSAVFRLDTKDASFGDVAVSFLLQNNNLVTTSRTPAVDWDGIHVFLRYQTEYWLYYASINRRDNTSIIKKKLPGGSTNGGTYYEIGSSVSHKVPYGAWQSVKATVKDNPDGSVTIALYDGQGLVVSATDNGVGGPPITAPGKVGIRGDNCNFQIDDFVVTGL